MSEKKKASDGDVGCFLLCCMALGWVFLSCGLGSYHESEALGCIIFGAGTFAFGFLLFLGFFFGCLGPKKKKKEKDEQETSSGDS